MRLIITKNYEDMSRKAANMLAAQVLLKPNSILGLATGSTPIQTYKNLISMYENGDVDFSKVTSFNLDEYVNLPRENENSYYYFMFNNLFNHINISKNNVHILNGMAEDFEREANEYEKQIKCCGGIDLQVLGIGNNGHIGFNEPSKVFESDTHIVNLKEGTIKANARFFNSMDEVPQKAISMGIKTIVQSKRIMLLANGENKSEAIYKSIFEGVTPEVPASILQLHSDATFIVDEAAAKLIRKNHKIEDSCNLLIK